MSIPAPVVEPQALPDGRLRIPEAPAIPGLVFRSYRGASDHAGMVDVLNATNEADGIGRRVTTEGMTADYAHLSNCDPLRDVVIAEVEGRIVGYARVYWAEDSGGGRVYETFGFIHPDFRRRGIGRAMLRHNERRLRRIAGRHVGVEPRWLSSEAAETQPGAEALLASEGYAPVRYAFDMERPTLDDIPDVPMPAGLEVRPVAADQLRRIWEANVEAFRDHWGEHDDTEEGFVRFGQNPESDTSLWQVAWDGDDVVGLVISTIYPATNLANGTRQGWLDDVAVRRPWRRRGLARALMARSLRALRESGMTSAGLSVDAENPTGALALYESVGFRPVRRYTSYRKPLDSRLSYGERQLRTFLTDGRLTQMPRQQKKKLALLRHVARSAFEADASYEEREVNRRLSAYNDDVATLRRLLVDHGFAERHAGIYRLRPEVEWPTNE